MAGLADAANFSSFAEDYGRSASPFQMINLWLPAPGVT
jgi:hypothetical protein